MKTQFQVKVFQSSFLLSEIMEIIANYNQHPEFCSMDIEDIQGFIKCKKIKYPSSLKKAITEIVMDELVVMEDGENVTFIIEEKKIVELKKETE